jgi:serine/threonine protein kinase
MVGSTISHYHLLSELGRGGMGEVFKAEDTRLKRIVAIKLLPATILASNPDHQRFTREAQLAAQLNHPAIATVFEFDEAEGRPFITMEYIDGVPLTQRIQSGPLTFPEVIRIGLSAGQGLAHAHHKGIVHRDIKPGNIMIARDGSVKILDFGLATIIGQSQRSGRENLLGTIPYMSPEQARGEELNAQTDIWSLAAVLYELISGARPFSGLYAYSLLYQIMHEDPLPLQEVRPETPGSLIDVVKKGMQREKNSRYHNIEELVRDLEFITSAPTTGRAPGVPKRVPEARGPAAKERRQVTIVFVRIGGLDALLSGGDPEVASSVAGNCMKGLSSISARYNGTTDMTVWNSLMIVFGAPVAYENDHERAVRCALDMVSYIEQFNDLHVPRLPSRLSLHVALHSGLVIAGLQEGEAIQKYSVIGETVNIAAGMVEVASDNEILVSADALKAVSTIVEVSNLRTIAVRGTTAPVTVYTVLRAVTHAELGERKKGVAEFVGRQKELTLFAEAAAQIKGKKEVLLFLRGEAGVGKSRLMLEFKRLGAEAGLVSYEGKCSSFEVDTPYYLWNSLLRSLLHVGPDAPEQELRSRLHYTVQLLSLESEEPYLATLLSLRYEQVLLETDRSRKGRIFEATLQLLQAFARREKTMVFLEDLHWIDSLSRELLDYLLMRDTIAPALFCIIYRPDYRGLVGFMNKGTLIDLDSLSPAEEERLISLRLAVSDVPGPLLDVVRLRAEGNPFFIEEILKTLLDQKAIVVQKGRLEKLPDNLAASVPETIQGVLMARIDRLEEHLRDILFDASVIGREFSRPVLEQVVNSGADVASELRELQALDFILEKEEAREYEYLFKHYLIQEVAYNTLLLERRKQLHGLIARTIEKLYAENLKPFYELLSFHFERAEEWEKAAEYLSRAGRKVREIYTRDAAEPFFARKDEALKKLFESAGASRIGWRLVGIFTALLSIPIALFMLAMPFFMIRMLFLLPNSMEFQLLGSRALGWVGFSAYISILIVIYPWVGLLFVFFGVLPFIKGRPRSFDVLEDSVSVVFRNGKRFTIHFRDIEHVRFYDTAAKAARPLLIKIIDPFFRVADFKNFTFGIWFTKVFLSPMPPYNFGFGARQGEIIIQKAKGFERLRVLLPFLNTPEKSRVVGLSPNEPGEFHEQLDLAIRKWKAGKS